MNTTAATTIGNQSICPLFEITTLSANQAAGLRTTPTTAAVMAECTVVTRTLPRTRRKAHPRI